MSIRKYWRGLIAAALFVGMTPAALAQTSASSNFDVSVTLTSQCKAKNSGTQTLSFSYTAFAAADVNATAPIDLTFDCTRNFTPASVAFDVGTDKTALGVGVVNGLQYTLTASAASVTTTGTAASTSSIGTASVLTYQITGLMPAGQAGDGTTATATQTRQLIVTF